jgi:hypothetical protein
MRKKVDQNKSKEATNSQNSPSTNTNEPENLNEINNNLMSLMQQMQNQNGNIDELLKKQNLTSENIPVKRKNNKKKNKGKKK